MALGSFIPYTGGQWCDNSGNPVPGAKIFFFAAGLASKSDTWSDANRTQLNTNPVVADANGRTSIFLGDTVYDCYFATPNASDPPVGAEIIASCLGLYQPSASNTADAIDEVAVAGENLAQNESVYLADGSGGTTAGRWYRTDADNIYSSSGAKRNGFAVSSILSGQSGVVRVYGAVTGLAGLVAGTLYYASTVSGAITASAPTNALVVGVADSTTVLLTPGPLNSLSVTVAQLVALTAGAEGNKTTIDARISVTLDDDGFIVNPYPKQIVHTEGTGTQTGRAPVFFDSIIAAAQNTAAGETTLWTKSLAGNSFAADGQYMYLRMQGTRSSANATTLKVKFGATSVTLMAPAAGTSWYFDGVIVRRTATTQRMDFAGFANGVVIAQVGSAAETLSGAVTVTVTGQGTNTGELIMETLTAIMY